MSEGVATPAERPCFSDSVGVRDRLSMPAVATPAERPCFSDFKRCPDMCPRTLRRNACGEALFLRPYHGDWDCARRRLSQRLRRGLVSPTVEIEPRQIARVARRNACGEALFLRHLCKPEQNPDPASRNACGEALFLRLSQLRPRHRPVAMVATPAERPCFSDAPCRGPGLARAARRNACGEALFLRRQLAGDDQPRGHRVATPAERPCFSDVTPSRVDHGRRSVATPAERPCFSDSDSVDQTARPPIGCNACGEALFLRRQWILRLTTG